MTNHRTPTNERHGDKRTSKQGALIRNPKSEIRNLDEIDYDELLEPVRFRFALDRRSFVQIMGGGVLLTAIGSPVFAQRQGRGRGGAPGSAIGAVSFFRRRIDRCVFWKS